MGAPGHGFAILAFDRFAERRDFLIEGLNVKGTSLLGPGRIAGSKISKGRQGQPCRPR